MFIPSYKKPAGSSVYVPPDWSTGTDEEIIEALEKHYNGEIDLTQYWSVGDERVISIGSFSDCTDPSYGNTLIYSRNNSVNETFVITGIGGRILSDGITECAFQIDQKTASVVCYWGYASGGANDEIRTWLNSSYANAISSSIKSIFKSFTFNQLNSYGQSVSRTGKMALRSACEMINTGRTADDTLYSYYSENTTNRIKTNNSGGNISYWMTRTPGSSSSQQYCVNNSNGTVTQLNSFSALIAPFGVI